MARTIGARDEHKDEKDLPAANEPPRMFLCIRGDAGIRRMTVPSYEAASNAVREYIDSNELGAGCSNNGWAFHLATIASDDKKRKLATVSYNGRVWSCVDGAEIKLPTIAAGERK